MPPVFKTAPTPAQFAAEWTRQFEATIKEAAGRDGRLSLSEARRIAERLDGSGVFSDNAVNYLEAKDQKSVSASVLVEAGKKYALAQATRAAGADGRLSLEDAKKLAEDLKSDFFMLRGKGPEVQPFRSDAELKADVRVAVLDALKASSALKLSSPPPELKGRKPLLVDIPAPGNTTVDVFVANNQIFLSRASPTPSPLVGFYRVGPVPPPKDATGSIAVKEALTYATEGLTLISETDANFAVLLKEGVGSGPVDANMVKAAFGPQLEALLKEVKFSYATPLEGLAGRPMEVRNPDDFFNGRLVSGDPGDPQSDLNAAKFRELKATLGEHLTDVHVFNFGEARWAPDVMGQVPIFIVGKTRSGALAGAFSAAVWT